VHFNALQLTIDIGRPHLS